MEGTITIPGAGPVKKQYVYLGAAGIAGFLAFAYYRRNQAATDAPPSWGDVDPGEMVPDGDYVNPGGNSNIPPQDLTGQTIKTNSQWAQAATTLLGNIGYDPKTVASAIGVFFQREGLEPAQLDAVKTAVGQLGPPPENGPWPIKAKEVAPPNNPPNNPPGDTLGPINNLRATSGRNWIRLDWDPVPGAQGYRVWMDGMTNRWPHREHMAWGASFTFDGLPQPDTNYRFSVEAVKNGVLGPKSQTTWHTTS